jgi:hypothetical protein
MTDLGMAISIFSLFQGINQGSYCALAIETDMLILVVP